MNGQLTSLSLILLVIIIFYCFTCCLLKFLDCIISLKTYVGGNQITRWLKTAMW